MQLKDIFEDSWSDENNAWHKQGSDDQWHGTDDQWHTSQGAGMVEDFAVTNLITDDASEFSHVLQARELIAQALLDPRNQRHRYFEFLKGIRDQFGSDYSTRIHQRAAKLIIKHKDRF